MCREKPNTASSRIAEELAISQMAHAGSVKSVVVPPVSWREDSSSTAHPEGFVTGSHIVGLADGGELPPALPPPGVPTATPRLAGSNVGGRATAVTLVSC